MRDSGRKEIETFLRFCVRGGGGLTMVRVWLPLPACFGLSWLVRKLSRLWVLLGAPSLGLGKKSALVSLCVHYHQFKKKVLER